MKALCGQVPVVRRTDHLSLFGDDRRHGAAAGPDRLRGLSTPRAGCWAREASFIRLAGTAASTRTRCPYPTISQSGVSSGLNPYLVVDESARSGCFPAHGGGRSSICWASRRCLDRSIMQVSNGERRKVLLARALLKSPRLLILDNPFHRSRCRVSGPSWRRSSMA